MKQPQCTGRVARRKTHGTGNRTRQGPGPHTQTTAAHAAQDRRRRDPPGTTPSQGPERVRRGVSPAPLPPQRPASGIKSPIPGQPPRAPRTRPVSPGAQAPGQGKGTTASRKLTGAPRATGSDEARRTNAGPQDTPEWQAAGNNQGTRTGAKHHRPPDAANPDSTHNPQRTTVQEQVPGNTQTHTPQITARTGGLPAEGAHGHTHPNAPARSCRAQPKPQPKHTHPPRTPQPGVAGYERGAHINTHTPQHPSQDWRGAADTPAQTHTSRPHTRAGSGGVQADHGNKHTHTPTPQP